MNNQDICDCIIKKVNSIIDERTLYAIYIFITHYINKKG